MTRFMFTTALAAVLCTGVGLRAQSSNPLTAPLPATRYGVEVGLNFTQQSGSFQSNCGCEFQSGSGTGFFVSGVGEMHLTPKLALMGKVTITNFTVNSKNITDTTETIQVNPTTLIDSVVPLTETATTRLTYFMLTPMIRYDITKQLFFSLGPSIGFAMSSSLEAQEASPPGLAFTDKSTLRIIQNGAIPSLSALRISIAVMIGYEFDIAPKLTFVPSASIDYPLTNVASGSTWKIAAYQIAGGVRWKLHI